MLHPLSVDVQCSIALLFIFIVMSFGITRLTLFFASDFVNVILLQRHVCVGRERNATFLSF